jgi:hypothetical protein
MRTTDAIKVLGEHGWITIREQGSHKMLQKGVQKLPFAYHDREIGTTQVRKLAARFGVPFMDFFKPMIQPKAPTTPVKAIEISPIRPVDAASLIKEGPIAGTARLVFLPVNSLQIDHRYQRPLNPRWARWLAENWDDRLLGIFTVSEREGAFFQLEGQHRAAALAAQGFGDRKVPCLAFKGLSLQEEADIYLGRNTVKSATAGALYTAKLAAGDPLAVRVHRVVEETYHLTSDEFKSYSIAFRLAEWDVLAETLHVWDRAWGQGKKLDRKQSLRAPLLMAIGAVIRFYGKTLNQERLSDQLKGHSGQEIFYMGAGRHATKAGRLRVTWVGIAEVLRDLYNYRLSQNTLPALDLTPRVVAEWGVKTYAKRGAKAS